MDWRSDLIELTLLATSYFAGICLRHKVLRHPKAPPLGHQILLGVFLFLFVQGVMFPVITMALKQPGLAPVLTVLGLTMEQGFFFNEGFARFCRERGLTL